MKQDLLDLTMDEMKQFAAAMGEKPYRGKQIFQWVHRGASSFDEMTDLPKTLREKLSEQARIGSLAVLDVQEDRTDGTRKFLFGIPAGETPDAAGRGPDGTGFAEGETPDAAGRGPDGPGFAEGAAGAHGIESVFMKYRYGNTLCVSSQIGCRMGCRFCASALGGFVRDLTAGEMMAQMLAAQRVTGEPIGHMVLMGMGEPFDNYENVSRFLRLLHDPEGMNMSWRHMTVSTSGIIPVMQRFAKDFPQVNLAISLHRIDDAGRSRIMPVNRRYPVKDLLDAAREYTEETGRRITFEYALIAGENDREEDARALIRGLKGMLCHVNLIPLNKVEETGLAGTHRREAAQFAARLEKAGIPVTVRRELGGGIDGACGQLRLRAIRG